jgi:type I restriction enzyme S subunit
MKYGWVNKRLGEVCEVITKGTTPTSLGFKFTDHGVNFIKVESLTETGQIIPNKVAYISEECHESLKRSQLKANDILFSIAGALGRIGIVNKEIIPANTNQALAIVRLAKDSGILVSFLAKYFTSNLITEEIEKLKGGAAQQNLSLGQLNNLMVPFPPLPEQQRIVSILDEAFDAIATAKANAEQNLKNTRELFESYLQGVFEKKGEGWEEKTLGEIAQIIGGYSFKSGDFKETGKYQVLRMGNVRPGIIRENESPVFIDQLDESALKRALLLPNDVIITQTGTKNKRDYGFTVIIEKEHFLLNQRISAIRFSKNYLPKFFLYFSWTNLFKDQYFANETGTVGQGNVGIGAITNTVIPYLSVKNQKTIIQKLDALSSETKRLEAIYQQKLADLEELKKSVLQKAFNGELTSKNILV